MYGRNFYSGLWKKAEQKVAEAKQEVKDAKADTLQIGKN